MKKLFTRFFGELAKSLGEKLMNISQPQEIVEVAHQEPVIAILPMNVETIEKPEEEKPTKKTIEKKQKKRPSKDIVEFDPRDMMELMEVPFLALSKNRKKPISYQSKDGKIKVRVSRHTEYHLASIYDWDVILLVSSKIQEIINSGSDIPPRTIIIPRNEILRSLHKHNGRKEEKDLKESLSRLKSTLIETTIRNEDGKYEAGFGFLDSWGYTDREDLKEIRITLSEWLYDGICRKGGLLKVSQDYFNLTSGLKKFLYRTARKHVGNNNQWDFSLEKLYEKSGSEQEFKKFKYKIKKAVLENDIPDYIIEWKEDGEKILIRFINKSKDSKEQKKVTPHSVKNEVNKVVSALRIPSHSKKTTPSSLVRDIPPCGR
jgi:plasmid replication initiation protein